MLKFLILAKIFEVPLMKVLSFLMFCSFFLCSSQGIGQSHQDWCGTKMTDADSEHIRKVIRKRDVGLAKNEGTTCIPMQAHIVLDENGNGGPIDLELQEAVGNLNHFFIEAGIEFYWKGPPITINSSEYYIYDYPDVPPSEVMDLFDAEQNAINIYICGNMGPAAGFASYPSGSTISNKIFLNENYVSGTNYSTLVHEMGHYLSLPHTFDNTENGDLDPLAENVARTGPDANCDVAGDMFCDTNADPGVEVINDVSSLSCTSDNEYFDGVGEVYIPPVENIMSYYPKSCRDMLSEEQYQASYQGLEQRLSSTSYSLDAPAMDVTAPSNLIAQANAGAVVLTWDDNADNEMGYNLEVSTSGTNAFKAAINTAATADQTNMTWNGYEEGLSYWFRIKATNGDCNSYSNVVFIGAGIDLDANNSSGAPELNYSSNALCGPGEMPISDNDVGITGSVNNSEIHIELNSALDGEMEYLSAPEINGLEISGNNTDYIIAENVNDLSSTVLQNWISQINYMHEGSDINDGTREITLNVVSEGQASPEGVSTIYVGANKNPGPGSSLTICPEGTANWDELPSNDADLGGYWKDENNEIVQGNITDAGIPGNYTYFIGKESCLDSAEYSITEIAPPELTTEYENPECETKCTGSIFAETSEGFQLTLNDEPFNGLEMDLCEDKYQVTTTNGTGCNRTKILDLVDQIHHVINFPDRICTSAGIHLRDYLDLEASTQILLDGTPVSLGQYLTLQEDRQYSLSLYDQANCLNREIEFYSEYCPTEETKNIYIPTAFTPDENGINDLFKVISPFELDNFRIQIFDRYGGIVYESTDQYAGWNGSVKDSGYYASNGIYHYKVEYQFPGDLEVKELTGNVTVLK